MISMVSWDVTVDNTTLNQVFDVQYDGGESEKLGEAKVVCGNNTNNRGISSGEEIKIKKNGNIDFRGYVVGKPTKAGASKTEIEIKALDKRMELKHQQVSRVFYNLDTGEIIRRIVKNKLKPFQIDTEVGRFIHKGESTSDWSTDIPRFSVGNIISLNLEKRGSDFLFLGWPEGSGDRDYYSATFNAVPSDTTVGDRQIDTFFTRIAINNKGEVFDAEVDLRDGHGNNYIWPLELPDTGFEKYELKAEDAQTTPTLGNKVNKVSSDSTLEYRFKISGTLAGSRGVALDYASTIPFAVESRNSDITTGGVKDSGNVVSRRVERSAFEAIKDFGVEDQYISYVDNNDVLHYEESGQKKSDLDIDTSTNVVDAEFNRDYRNVTNKVTVEGDGDIRVTVEQKDSIKFYGVASRDEPIIDESIETEQEAKRRGEGFLSKNAWDDEAFKFVIGNTDYEALTLGEDVFVNWPDENILGTYQVSNTETDRHGYVSISLTKRGTF